jgi:uncharacterized protein (TIGR04255 family)
MKIPKKITPDRIRDSIVEVRYNTHVPYEALIGIFYQAVKDSFKYSNRPLGKQQFPISAPALPQEITLSLGGLSLFHNDKIKVQLQPNSIIFNCVGDYVGWENYKSEIEKAITIFSNSIEIESYSRLGIRYISEYPNYDLVDCVKFNFTFGMPDIKSDTYSFRSEFKWEEYKVILNFNNKLLVVRKHGKQPTSTSIIDLDVIENINEKDLKTLLTKLDRIHSKEKEVFFNIIDEKFLETLNPEY